VLRFSLFVLSLLVINWSTVYTARQAGIGWSSLIAVFTDVTVCTSCMSPVFRVADASADNKMNVANLATVFGPVLINSEADSVTFVRKLILYFPH